MNLRVENLSPHIKLYTRLMFDVSAYFIVRLCGYFLSLQYRNLS